MAKRSGKNGGKAAKFTRKCAACGRKTHKSELIRICSRTAKVLPPGRNMEFHAGRSIYLCSSYECLKRARKSKRLEKNPTCKINEIVYNYIEGAIRC
jgi:predicted RNA-binding protein YlxR (DUF448 family)